MATKTVHVYPVNGTWAVKWQGRKSQTFVTKREAVSVAIAHTKKARAAQLAIYDRAGRVVDHRTYSLPRIQNPPKRSSRSKKIAKAVSELVFERLRSDDAPRRVAKTEK